MHKNIHMSSQKTDAPEFIGSIKVNPHDLAELHVGIYENKIPEPEFALAFIPNMANLIEASLERADRPGEYELVYCFHNHSDKPCTVTVSDTGRQNSFQHVMA